MEVHVTLQNICGFIVQFDAALKMQHVNVNIALKIETCFGKDW